VSLQNKVVIIIGGASGIGLAAARLLLTYGVRLSIWDYNPAALSQAAQELKVQTQIVDIRDPKQVATAFRDTETTFGQIDVVIHSAAILRTGFFAEMPLDEHLQMTHINLGGTATVAQLAIPHLLRTDGSLILLSSVSAFIPAPEFASYAATKAGVFSLAQSLRIELEETGIHIGVASPLYVSSPMLDERAMRTRGVNSKSAIIAVYTPEQVARSLVRGIERREFMIWTGIRPRLIYLLSRYAAGLIHSLTRWTWKYT
jgi:hypothetical protein